MMLADRRGAPCARPALRRVLPSSGARGAEPIRPQPAGGPKPARGSGKRVLDVEDVLRWAYRDELPKTQGWGADTSPMFRVAELGTLVDSSNYDNEPGFPAAAGDPHPDALLVQGAVARLRRFAGFTFEEPRLAPDLWFGVDQGAVARVAIRSMTGLIVVNAKLGARPTWWQGPPALSPVVGQNGKPRVLRTTSESFIAEDGKPVPVADQHDAPCQATRAGKYPEGAFCPLDWHPAPSSIVLERAQYLTWWAGLDALAGELALASITVLPPSAPPRPWFGDRELGKPPALFAPRAPMAKPQSREAAAARRSLAGRRTLPRVGSTPSQVGASPKPARHNGTKD